MNSSTKKYVVRAAKWLFRLAILAAVAWGVGRTCQKGLQELKEKAFSWSDVHWPLLLAAGGFYLSATAPNWLFWRKILQAMGQQPEWLASLRAFYIGHLGKYVPGKAMVVVLRTSLVRSPRVQAAAAAVSVFVETLTMMAVGGLTAAVLLGALYREHLWLLGLAIALAACAGVPTWPPLFRRIVLLAGVKKADPKIETSLQGIDFRLMGQGWLMIGVSWWLMGLSLWAILEALPGTTAIPFTQALPLLTACVALAMVAGFISLLPGGVGVRETVVMTLLAPVYGPADAMISAVLLRLVWLASELAAGAVLYPLRRNDETSHDES